MYVNQNASGENDGTNWQDAFISLKAACEAAALFPEDTPKQIWIAKGTYKPGTAQADYFPITANTSYYGGFAGNETSLSQRNTSANPVIISGDLGGGTRSLNLFSGRSIIYGDVLFDGLSFSGARASLSTDRSDGSAINITLPSVNDLTIENCKFTDLQAEGSGGAIYISGGNVTVINTDFSNCSSLDGTVLYANRNENVTLTEVELRNCDGDVANKGFITFFLTSGLITIKDCVFEQVSNDTFLSIMYFYGDLNIDGLTMNDIDITNVNEGGIQLIPYRYITSQRNIDMDLPPTARQ
jgi:hypothetical protein